MSSNEYQHWKVETDDEGILWCHIDVAESSSNVLSATVLGEFDAILDSVSETAPSGLIILSDKDNGFIAGADIREFTRIENDKDALELVNRGQAVFNKLESLSIPTLALINGYCLGGGLELALACDYRILLESDKVRVGLPEVLLGIHPGFGGSMRLIRLIGVDRAMPLMLQGRTVDTRAAKKLGIVDFVVPERQFMNAGPALIRRRPTPAQAGRLRQLLNKTPIRQVLAAVFNRQLQKKVKKEQYPAPYALVDIWKQHGDNTQALLRAEALSVARLANNSSSRNLVRVFMLQERLKALKGDKTFQPETAQIIGAGIMGGDIAAWCVLQGMTVGLQDREPKYIAPAMARAHTLYQRKLKNPRLVMRAMDRLLPDINGINVDKADVVIEAIVENTEAKTALFSEIEPRLKADAVLATNTSSISLEQLNVGLADPARLVGIHFFNPVARMQLVEIIHAENTGEQWIDRALAFCRSIGRLPLPVKSSPGFLVNRILTPYLMEAMTLQEEGIMPSTIDRVAVAFGMPMGPVELADTVGLDICLHVARNLEEKLELNIPQRLEQMVESGKLGKKTGAGFYQYKKGKPEKEDSTTRLTDSESMDIENRLVLRILNECAASLREGIVEDADMLDAGMIFGTGFPPFRGGPMHYAASRGYDNIIAILNELADRYGDRYKPDAYWLELTNGDAN